MTDDPILDVIRHLDWAIEYAHRGPHDFNPNTYPDELGDVEILSGPPDAKERIDAAIAEMQTAADALIEVAGAPGGAVPDAGMDRPFLGRASSALVDAQRALDAAKGRTPPSSTRASALATAQRSMTKAQDILLGLRAEGIEPFRGR